MNTSHTGIVTTLFQIADDLHWHHLNDRSYAEHKALDFAYGELVSYKDTVAEQLIPFEGKLGVMKLLPVPSCTKVLDLPEDIIKAAATLREFATAKKYNNLVNISDEIAAVGAKLKYLLNLT